MSATERLTAAALALVAANERIHGLRVAEPCEQYEPQEDRYPGVEACWSHGAPVEAEALEHWCPPCRARAANWSERRVARDARRKRAAGWWPIAIISAGDRPWHADDRGRVPRPQPGAKVRWEFGPGAVRLPAAEADALAALVESSVVADPGRLRADRLPLFREDA